MLFGIDLDQSPRIEIRGPELDLLLTALGFTRTSLGDKGTLPVDDLVSRIYRAKRAIRINPKEFEDPGGVYTSPGGPAAITSGADLEEVKRYLSRLLGLCGDADLGDSVVRYSNTNWTTKKLSTCLQGPSRIVERYLLGSQLLPSEHPSSIAQVNSFFKENGFEERLKKGPGYYYFTGGTSALWRGESGVYVNHVGQLSLEQWVEELKAKRSSIE